MTYTPDKDDRTVSIPIQIIKGQTRLLYGGICLPLKEGEIGDLILPARAVLDRELLHLLEGETEAETLPAFSVIMLAMSGAQIPPEHAHQIMILPPSMQWSKYVFVPVVTTKPLKLLMRGTKSAHLLENRCWLPTLHRDAISLNHAYSLLSTVLEPDRRAHTGNVFDRACYYEDGRWRELNDLRKDQEALSAQTIIDYFLPKTLQPPALLAADTQCALELDSAPDAPEARQEERDILMGMIDAHQNSQFKPVAIDSEMYAFIAKCYHLPTP